MTVVFMDTNPFVRYFTNDVPHLAQRVQALLEQAKQGKVKLITNEVIIAELVWVLESVYDLKKPDVYKLISSVINTPNFNVINRNIINEALAVYVNKNIDYVDAYTAVYMKDRNLKKLCSFNKKHMGKIDWIELIEP